ncbi:MAG: hypothetical protein BWY75_02690 [bacterium ADurb.Bin425]|nr:MAG: hypothetical protein BWY75_02690 [bacterium ADurb.Bin425]
MPIKGIGIVNKAPPDALLQITSLGMASHQTNNQTNNQANKQTTKQPSNQTGQDHAKHK